MTTSNAPELHLYSRSGCHLCEDMLASLNEFAGNLPIGAPDNNYNYTVTVVDIDSDAGLHERFNVLVPALYLADQEVCHHFLDLKRLMAMLDDFRNPSATNG